VKTCKSCGADLIPTDTSTPRRTFCGDSCRSAYRHKRAKEEEIDRNEWYSPPDIVDAARAVMGGVIDLDPASCWRANHEIVKALDHYTKSDNGLKLDWKGRVWLNPPYGVLAPKFFAKFCDEYEAERVSMACILLGIHHLTTRWFQRVECFPHILCLPGGRLKFTGDLAQGNQPMHGSAILGVGVNPKLFRNEFGSFGAIYRWEAPETAVPAPAPAPLVLVSSRG